MSNTPAPRFEQSARVRYCPVDFFLMKQTNAKDEIHATRKCGQCGYSFSFVRTDTPQGKRVAATQNTRKSRLRKRAAMAAESSIAGTVEETATVAKKVFKMKPLKKGTKNK